MMNSQVNNLKANRILANELILNNSDGTTTNISEDINSGYDFIIVGCGVAALWAARKLAIEYPDKKILMIASGENLDKEKAYNGYSPDREIGLDNSSTPPEPPINAVPVLIKNINDEFINADIQYRAIGGNTLINACEITLDKIYFSEDYHNFVDEVQEVVNPIIRNPINEINVPDENTKNYYIRYTTVIENSIKNSNPNIAPYRMGFWIDRNQFFTGPRYDPYRFILDENGNQFTNIDILENTFVHNLNYDVIEDETGESVIRCIGTRNVSSIKEQISFSNLNNNGKIILSAGYLGTTRILSNFKDTIPRSLQMLNNVGTRFEQIPSYYVISIIPNLKPEFSKKGSNLNIFTAGPSPSYKINGSDNLGENGYIAFTYLTGVDLNELLFLYQFVKNEKFDIANYTPEQLDRSKDYLILASFVNYGIKYNPYLDSGQNTIKYTHKGDELLKTSIGSSWPTDISAIYDPSLYSKNYFNSELNVEYLKFKENTPQSIQDQLFDELYDNTLTIQKAHKDMVKNMSTPGTVDELIITYKVDNNPEIIIPEAYNLTALLKNKVECINTFFKRLGSHNWHLTTGNSQFVNNDNLLNNTDNVYIGDQSVYEHFKYGGSYPNSTGVASMSMAEKVFRAISKK